MYKWTSVLTYLYAWVIDPVKYDLTNKIALALAIWIIVIYIYLNRIKPGLRICIEHVSKWSEPDSLAHSAREWRKSFMH